jgi:hypothetical protein
MKRPYIRLKRISHVFSLSEGGQRFVLKPSTIPNAQLEEKAGHLVTSTGASAASAAAVRVLKLG